MTIEKLKTKLNSLPKKPGVYIFRNPAGKIIYLGKALSLRPRVKSYFQQKHQDFKNQELIKNIADLEFIIVNSEFEALLLEARLIKQHEPKYNIIQKDNKSYLYIVISKDFPNRVFTARGTELGQSLDAWYGPFPSSTDTRRILKFIRRIFPFRSCKTLPKKACLYKDLNLCPGVCEERDNRMIVNSEQSQYHKTIKQIRQILSGKIKTLINSLEKEIKAAARNLKYEDAQKIKEQINSLNYLTSGWQNVPSEKQDTLKAIGELRQLLIKYQGLDPLALNKIEGYDVSNLGKEVIVGAMVAFSGSEPDKSQYRKFNLKYNLSGPDDPEGIGQIVRRRLNHSEWVYPQLILIDGGKTQVSAAFSAIKEAGQAGKISLLGLTKEFETIIVPKTRNEKITGWQSLRLSRRSPGLQLLQAVRDEAHRFARKYYQFLHLKRSLVR